ncbi:putative N-acetylmuramoyl alanine amidase [Waddlia chondrophila 2032/99]|uniref:N-acetylmuramoyl-L-alanine amidase n=2 Tax=Waddlia chondrophila TaxID=71667 RepID=D6YUB7_WADCW|nr:N-acetylmuramoyl-L-alanine amidase [Waddlia chondrophila]ADI37728.1 putative N-acetylmuramoyl alanine amidase [Waddlia chondrophila WSU 86-1044]CCB90928.1 putative N-acetylmuramoyl alanine amidase [Waddlia chondrophila 2032/99]
MIKRWIKNVWVGLIAVVFAGCASKSPEWERSDHEVAAVRVRREAVRPVIVIDAGHGGKDLGAKCPDPQTEEKALNLQTALLLNQFLQQKGYQTILTRGEDFFVPLKMRADFANSNRATLFVSVHYNSAPNKAAEGVEVYYYDNQDDLVRTSRSKILAQKVLDRVIASTKMKSRGIKNGNFAVIRETRMPAILIEGGFMTNEKELARLRDPAHIQRIAESIANGVQDYLRS